MDRLRLGKDYRKPVAELRRRGWTLTHTTGRHPKLTCPAGRHAIPVPTNVERLEDARRLARRGSPPRPHL